MCTTLFTRHSTTEIEEVILVKAVHPEAEDSSKPRPPAKKSAPFTHPVAWERSGRTVRKGGVKTRSTRTVRKVTTVTRGEQSVTSESVMRFESGDTQRYPAIREDKKSLKFRVVDDKVTF